MTLMEGFMGFYRLAFYFKWMLALGINFETDTGTFYGMDIYLPFIKITIAFTKEAEGVRFFKD